MAARKTKPRLGRGLSSLLGEPARVDVPGEESATSAARPPAEQNETATESPPTGQRRIQMADVRRIIPSRHQPRREMAADALEELAASIRSKGVMQPVLLRPITTEDARALVGEVEGEAAHGLPKWELVAGERRWRAARRAGLDRVPAIVVELDERESAEWAIVENIQREDLNAMERAWAFRKLCEEFELSHADVGRRVGLARASVTNFVRLTELEPEVQELVAHGRLSMGHARALLAMEAGEARRSLAQKAASEGWSVRELEKRAGAGASRSKARKPRREPDERTRARLANLGALEKQLGEHLGTRVAIRTDSTGAKGRISIDFYGIEHFDGLMRLMGFEASL